MQKKTRSLLEELNTFASKKDKEIIIESRATHIIDSAINFIKMLHETFDAGTAFELERRFLNSIKGADSSKFSRGIRKIRDSKEVAKNLKLIEGNAKDE